MGRTLFLLMEFDSIFIFISFDWNSGSNEIPEPEYDAIKSNIHEPVIQAKRYFGTGTRNPPGFKSELA